MSNNVHLFEDIYVSVRDSRNMSITEHQASISRIGRFTRKSRTSFAQSELMTPSVQTESNRHSSEHENIERRDRRSSMAGNHHSEVGYKAYNCGGGDDGGTKEESPRRPNSPHVPLKTRRTGRTSPNIDMSNISRGPKDEKTDLASRNRFEGRWNNRSMDEAVDAGYSGIWPEDGKHPLSESLWIAGRAKLEEESSERKNSNCNSASSVLFDVKSCQASSQRSSGFTPLLLNQESLAIGMSWLWQTSAFSDLVVSCGTHDFPVHKCVLAAQCRKFNISLHDEDALTATSKGSTLFLHDEDPNALKAMLQYLYTGCLVVPEMDAIILGRPEAPSITFYSASTSLDLNTVSLNSDRKRPNNTAALFRLSGRKAMAYSWRSVW